MTYTNLLYVGLALLPVAMMASTGLNLRAAEKSSPAITAEERAHLLKLLKDSETEFLSAIENVNDEQWKWKPAPDRWSVGETAEHILLAESPLFGGAQRAIQSPPNPDWQAKTAGKTDFLEKAVPDRSRKATAPESIRPHDLSKADVIRRYKETRAETIHFVETTQVPLKEHTFDHPFPIIGTLNAYQWLLYIPLHNLRHDQQIAEVKASPAYPK